MNDSFQLGFDRESNLDHLINELLTAKDLQPWPLTDEQRRLLRILQWHKGAKLPVTIAVLSEKLSLTEREIKESVRGLIIDYGLPIVGLRRPPYGYFLATSPDEITGAVYTLNKEVIEICRRIRALKDSDYLREMLGQIPIELDKEAS